MAEKAVLKRIAIFDSVYCLINSIFMRQNIVFKFNFGFGNRLCNLMNLFYIHEKYPNALIYINWIINDHCNIPLNDIIDLTKHDFILPYDKYDSNNKSSEIWASTSTNNRSKWDNIEEWVNHNNIVSVAFHMYSFVSNDYCKNIFNNVITFKETINTIVSNKIKAHGSGNRIIHFRGGDLIKILSENESTDKINNLMQKKEQLHPRTSETSNSIVKGDNILYEYNQTDVNRTHDKMLESIAELIYLSKHNCIIGYCPYSHFSSWVFLLSSNFIDNQTTYPIFNSKIIDIILLS